MSKMIRTLRADGVLEVGAGTEKFAIDGKALVGNDPRFDGFADRLLNSQLRGMLAGNMANVVRGARVDADTGYALARELEYVSAVITQQPLADLTSMSAIPLAVDQPQPFQEVYTWKTQTWTKGGRISRSYKDLGTRGDIQVQKNSQNVVPYIGHASWGLDDLSRAALGNVPLPALELQGALRAISEQLNSDNWFGDSAQGISGLYGATGVTTSAVANGVSGSPLWANKTPDEIEADCTELINAVVEAVKGKGALLPNRLALSVASYSKLATTARSQLSSMTILQFVQQALESVGMGGVEITKHPELADNGSGSKWMVLYRYDPQVMGRIMPLAPTFLPPDIESTYITQALHAQGGGLNIRYPVAIQIRTGM